MRTAYKEEREAMNLTLAAKASVFGVELAAELVLNAARVGSIYLAYRFLIM